MNMHLASIHKFVDTITLLNLELKKIFLTLTLLTSCLSVTYAQVSITTDALNANYEKGDNASFIINSTMSGTVSWKLKYDNFAPEISSGTINITAGQPETISHTESVPGVVFCEVTQGGNTANASVLFSPYEISPMESKPSDLNTFWNSKIQEINNVPLNPVVTMVSSTTYTDSYSVVLDHIDGRKVYGYLSVPKSTGPFPAVISLPPYGSAANITVIEDQLAERAGVLSFSVSIHNVAPNQVDPNAYSPDNYEDEDGNYYKYALLGAVQAINYIQTRSDFDGQNVGVTGISQGGGLSICLAGIDDRINLLMYSLPTLSQNAGLAHNKAGGFPNYINRSRGEEGTSSHEAATIDATRYYDGMFLAQSCNYPVLGTVSYRDLVTPAATGLTAFNALPNTHPRILLHAVERGHDSPNGFFQSRIEFIHRYFPSTLTTTPFPWNIQSGYAIDAGTASASAFQNTPYPLQGNISQNTTINPSFDLEWSLVSGPGSVTFADANAYSTDATFSQPGTYLLQFKGTDNSTLNSNKEFTDLVDYITVTVQSFVPLPVELISFESSLKDEKVLLQWATASELNNEGFEIQRSEEVPNRFENIGFVQGLNTSLGGSYSFWDKNVAEGKTYYYRLQQIDFDGATSYSELVTETIPIRNFQVKIYPNLVKENLTIAIKGEGSQDGELMIFSSQGQLLKTERISFNNQLEKTILVNDLSKGIYFVQIKLPKLETEILKFVKF